ncbi:hypothetical protein GCM10023196_036290 [Actinoallomurus vinaceus]|uniref:Antitoxin VbhA domain-containing protein n=1 Tax=Actinoallomurus vinaceus TaxID=1080074 RepID=A0ABP8UDN4_9ACTN
MIVTPRLNLDEDEVRAALYIAAKHDRSLLDADPTRAQARMLITRTIESYGLATEGLENGLSDYEAAAINGWSDAQTRRVESGS